MEPTSEASWDLATAAQVRSLGTSLQRLKVYGHLFNVSDNFFELWAPKEWTKKDARAKNTWWLIAAQKKGRQMMCLCQKVRGEVAGYFDRGNNFRFSHGNGIIVMENTASDDLTIALVIDYRMAEREPEDLHDSQTRLFDLRQARWIAAYAAVMSYEVGHTGWEVEGP
ncbi:hypothetical protein UCDDA912_g03482 [Diaporthe ampelina]|uniref:Uncharacterized protein n=1 Tax=Diaporthe ampelina TaxID=1214573 RepID=A0A0G2FRD4_9PEZI|nr:hypothetical protein UCDDA912_g03482 [Diaporthe ampelina]